MRHDGLVSKIATAVLLKCIEKIETTPFIKIGVSNRHLHVSREDLDALFGKDHALTPIKELLPGQYACGETVTIIGPKSSAQKVRILGPTRDQTQLEISTTDSFVLGVPAPVNVSGNLSGAGSVIIENPLNGAQIERTCAIVAIRHIHLTVDYARKYGFQDKQWVEVEFDGCRKARLGNVLVRVAPDVRDEMHIDTDEANAVYTRDGEYARIIP